MVIAALGPPRGRVGGIALAAVAGLAAIAGPALGAYWVFVFSVAVVYVILALSLVVLTGWSGQLNLHAAALGLGWGAYSAFALVAHGVPPIWALALAGVVAAPFAAIVAAVAVRFRGLELAVATLALGLIFERLFFRNLAKVLGRAFEGNTTPFESSFVSMPRPSIGGLRFDSDTSFFYLSLVFAVVLFVLVTGLDRGATGRTLRALREREVAAEVLGVPTVRYRIGAFVLSIMLAATAGGLFASLKSGIAPDDFNIDLSFQLLAVTVIGGIRSPGGAAIGGTLLALMPEVVRSGPLRVLAGERLFLLFAVGMIVVLWRRPAGLASIVRERARRSPDDSGASLAALAVPGQGNGEPAGAEAGRRRYATRLERQATPSILRVEDLRVRFGGVVALDGASLSIPRGEVCALIGPNGAGKSTLFNCISGVVAPDEGRVYFDGGDVTDLPAHRRAALGIGRTFQTAEVFRDATVLDNLRVAGHLIRRAGPVAEALRLPGARRSERAIDARAREVLVLLGLETVAERHPGELPLGLLRVLQVGMALVPRPVLLLLDEPSAGLDPAETEALARLIARLRSAYRLGVLLVEHDMSMVGRVAEHVYVLDFGRILAQGTPEEIRRDPLVLEKYLGAEIPDTPAPARRRRAGGARVTSPGGPLGR